MVKEWPRPSTGKDVQRFLGFLNYFREFIANFSSISQPLDALRNEASIDSLTEAQLSSFEILKQSLLKAPILSFPNFQEPFFLATDASNSGLAAVLFQDSPENSLKPWSPTRKIIGFFSKSLSKAEKNYSATKKELLAVVRAMKYFHYYLWDNPFTLITDHRALTFMHSQKSLNALLTNWFDQIFSYNFKTIHCPGIRNVLPDLLSRIQYPVTKACLGSISAPSATAQASLELAQNSSSSILSVDSEEERDNLLSSVHSLGHFGFRHLRKAIEDQGFTWKSILKDCRSFVKNCHACQVFNSSTPLSFPLNSLIAKFPFDHIVIDLLGPLPLSSNACSYLLVLIDVCSRFVILEPIQDKSAHSIAASLLKTFSRFGLPKVVQSDNGLEFCNAILSSLLQQLAIEKRTSLPYNPRCNGIVERGIKTISTILKKILYGNISEWYNVLPHVELSMNLKIHEPFELSPFSIMFTRQPTIVGSFHDDTSQQLSNTELSQRLKCAQEYLLSTHQNLQVARAQASARSFAKSNRLANENDFPLGSLVLKRNYEKNSKFDPPFIGPYKILKKTKANSFVLADLQGILLPRNVPASHLKAYSSDIEESRYSVEAILSHKMTNGKLLYLVRWDGYSSDHDTWEPPSSFDDPSIIKTYWSRIQEESNVSNI